MTASRVDGRPGGLPTDDPALVGALAVYEALRTYGGRPFRVAAHLARLRASAAWLGIDPPDEERLVAEITEVVAEVGQEAVVRVVLTGAGRRVVDAAPLDPSRVGAPVRCASLVYEAPDALPGWVKSTSRAAPLLAARRAGVDEVLFVGRDGTWTEANRSNILAVRAGTVFTPAADGRILAGVTRGAMLDCAAALGVPVVEGPLVPGEYDELYLASTLKELAPIVAIDGRAAAGGGPVGAALWAAFRREIEESVEVDATRGRLYCGAR